MFDHLRRRHALQSILISAAQEEIKFISYLTTHIRTGVATPQQLHILKTRLDPTSPRLVKSIPSTIREDYFSTLLDARSALEKI